MPRAYVLVAFAYLSFISIGIQSAFLGVAWTGPPGATYIGDTFHQPLDAVGVLLAASTAGYVMASLLSGRLLGRFRVGSVLACSMAAAGAAMFGYVVSPSWALAVLCAFVLGAGGGMLDTSLNIYFAAHHGPRLMNWLHACFGIGTTIGPFVMSASIAQTGSWRAAYAVGGCLHLGCAILYFASRKDWGMAQKESHVETPVKGRDTLRLKLVWIGAGMFLAYTGLEMCMGQWAFPLFAEARKVPVGAASQYVSIYWGSFTVGRIAFGFLSHNVPLSTLVRSCLITACAAAVLLALNPFPASGPIAVGVFGFAISPLWAMLMVNTQKQLGPDHAPHAIGYQVAAASLGFGLTPGLAGVVAQRSGLETVPIFLIGLSVMMLALFELAQRQPTPDHMAAKV